MNGQSGLQNMQNTDAVGDRRDGVGTKAAAPPLSPAAAPPAAAGPMQGTLYRLDGLQARPELNGCVVVVIAEVDTTSGRVPVRLLPSAPAPGAGLPPSGDLKVRLHNLLRLKPGEQVGVPMT